MSEATRRRTRRRTAAAISLAIVVALGVAAIAARSSDLGDGALPPPYRDASGAILVRVGLETDLKRFVLPCCEPVWVDHDGNRRSIASGVEVTPGGQAKKPTYKLQVAALKDEEQARTLARSLERKTSAPAQVSFDVSSSLYRVRLGRFSERAAADRLGHRLVDQGIEGAWVVEEGGGLEHAALTVVGGEPRKTEAPGRWVAIEPDGGSSVRLDRGRYRGRILVYLNDRGLLNVIDELALDDYLRGVVPVEMGPDLYDTLDALKAQAVSARTYTVRGLGAFGAEGFDICASPRCQAYGGMDSEHPLSDRAVAETKGEIVIRDGLIAEALYSASCGGSTEDVEVVFPNRTGAHLRGVPCAERGAVRIAAGTVDSGASYADWKARIAAPTREERAYFLGFGGGEIEVRTGDLRRKLAMGPAVATFARAGGELRSAPLDLAPGDRLRLLWNGDRLIAVASDHEGLPAPTTPVQPWSVFRREDELRRSIATLYPGFSLRDLEVVSRGGSGRIGKLRLVGSGQETVVLEGLAVRWTLGTPETWFDLRRASQDGHRGWLFEGRGRGHGVGLCQIGAVAMSRRGQTYKEILAHYYSGARLGTLAGTATAEQLSTLVPRG